MLKALAVSALVLALITVSYVSASLNPYYNAGTLTTAVNGTITKVINMQNERELAIILKLSSGNFASQLLNVSASVDNSTFYKVESISAGTSTTKVLEYSDTNKGATLAVNPSIFPFLKIEFPKVNNKSVTLTWSAVRG